MEIREQIKVLRAFKRGSTIEYYNENSRMWLEIGNNRFTAFNFGKEKYRIKPRPTYVPFTWEDRDLFRDKWVRPKKGSNEHRINFISDNETVSCANWKEPTTLTDLFEHYEFIDGSIFGKLKQ